MRCYPNRKNGYYYVSKILFWLSAKNYTSLHSSSVYFLMSDVRYGRLYLLHQFLIQLSETPHIDAICLNDIFLIMDLSVSLSIIFGFAVSLYCFKFLHLKHLTALSDMAHPQSTHLLYAFSYTFCCSSITLRTSAPTILSKVKSSTNVEAVV